MAGSRTAAGALALLLAVAGVVAGDHLFPPLPAPDRTTAVAETRPLTSATLVCPDVDEAAGAGRSSQVSYTSEEEGGVVTAHWLRVGKSGTTRPETTAPGGQERQSLPVQTGNFAGVILNAVGPAAAGFTAGVTSTYDVGTGTVTGNTAAAGSARLACLAPTSDAYLVGPATTIGHDPRLVLINPDPSPANVDVSVAQDGKPFSRENTHGVALAGYGRTTIALVGSAPEQAAVAVHVQTRSGRVTAAVRDRWFTGSVPQGIDWLPAGAAPAKDVVLPGVGGPSATVTLVVASSSTDAGQLVVQALNADGEFIPAGLQSVEIAPGAIVHLTIPRSAFPTLGALHVTSDVPILAAAVTARPGNVAAPRPDFAWTPAVAALTAAAPGPPGSQLVLTSPTDTSVDVSAASGGAATTVTVQVPAGTAVRFSLDQFPGGVVVTPREAGTVRAAVVDYPLGGGGAVTIQPLVAPARTVVLRPARPDVFLGSR